MSTPSRIRPALLASALLLATASVTASEPKQPRTIIVMDGSGSMWGQIDGRPKLEIARETVADVVGKLPADQSLGLIAYAAHLFTQVARIRLDDPVRALSLFRSNREAGFILLIAVALGAIHF